VFPSIRSALAIVALTAACPLAAHAQIVTSTPAGTAFTYQGRLEVSGQPATGTYDLEFRLYGGPTFVSFAVGSPIVVEDVQVNAGLFTTRLDFGPQFTGRSRWMGVGVRPGNSTGAFTALNPRQELTPSPYAIGLALPYVGSDSADAPLFTLGNLGTGGAMALSSTSGDTLAVTSSNGDAIQATAVAGGNGINATSSSGSAAVRGANNGTGPGVYGQIGGPSSTAAAAIYGYSLGSAGNAAFFRTESTANPSNAMEVQNNGSGIGLHVTNRTNHSALFENTNAAGTNGGVMSTVAGIGIPIWGKTTGASAAGRFDIDNASSTANALEVNNLGNGLTAKFNGGDVQVNGNLYAQVGTVLNRATPIGWGTIDGAQADNLLNSSGNVTVTWEGNGVYRIQLVGEGSPTSWVVVASCSYAETNVGIIYIAKSTRATAVVGQPGTGVFRIEAKCIAGCDEFEPNHYTDFVVYKGF
jgi:hypothetical protein